MKKASGRQALLSVVFTLSLTFLSVLTASAMDLVWSYKGPVKGMHNIQISEASSGGAWMDNYLATDKDYGISWSFRGKVSGKANIAFPEGDGGGAWSDNYLVVPDAIQKKYQFVISVRGRIPGKTCLPIPEPSLGGAWNDNYLCYDADDDYGIEWSYKGPISGKTSVLVNEPSSGRAWQDNYLCFGRDYGVKWSYKGPLGDMISTLCNEGEGGGAWGDNYLCTPPDAPFSFVWSNNGPIVGIRNIAISEPSMGAAWNDNYIGLLPMMEPDCKMLESKILEYAPVFHFTDREIYLPTSAEEFLKSARPAPDNERKPGLKLKSDSETLRAGNLEKAKVYTNVKVHGGYTEIQYWLLYAYNGPGTSYLKRPPLLIDGETTYQSMGDRSMNPLGVHEGDWEHIAVRIANGSGALLKVYLAQHDGGRWIDSDKVLKDKRIKIYISSNGHASYATSERHYDAFKDIGILEFRLLNDTSNANRELDARKCLQIIGLSRLGKEWGADQKKALEVSSPDWMKYTGRWGKCEDHGNRLPGFDVELLGKNVTVKIPGLEEVLKEAGIYDELVYERGPAPPWSKSSWLSDE